jgi:Sulfotransferase domain
MKRPDLFVVGAPKCGTTAMYEYLRAHPEIFMSPIKELHYFSQDVFDDYRPYGPKNLGEYLDCFKDARSQKRVGECSPTYLGSPAAPAGIKSFNPQARIVIMLRNPTEAMYALHNQHVWDTTESVLNFEAALEADRKWATSSRGRRLPGLSYRETVKYAEQVQRYFGVFGREKVFIIIYDDFSKSPKLVYRDTLCFLDVNPNFMPKLAVVNSSHAARNLGLQRFLVQRLAPAARVFPKRLQRSIGRALLRLNTLDRARLQMNKKLRRQLQIELRPEIEQLSCLLKRDLSSWYGNE